MDGESAGSAVLDDEGLREWYRACPCCMSQANPEAKAAFDREKREQAGAGTGCSGCEDHESG